VRNRVLLRYRNRVQLRYRNRVQLRYRNRVQLRYRNRVLLRYRNRVQLRYRNRVLLRYRNRVQLRYRNRVQLRYRNRVLLRCGIESCYGTGTEFSYGTGTESVPEQTLVTVESCYGSEQTLVRVTQAMVAWGCGGVFPVTRTFNWRLCDTVCCAPPRCQMTQLVLEGIRCVYDRTILTACVLRSRRESASASRGSGKSTLPKVIAGCIKPDALPTASHRRQRTAGRHGISSFSCHRHGNVDEGATANGSSYSPRGCSSVLMSCAVVLAPRACMKVPFYFSLKRKNTKRTLYCIVL
jgi:hypothetical protein